MRIGTLSVIMAAVGLAAPAAAHAADKKVAVVDVKAAMKASTHWKQAVSTLEKEKGKREETLKTAQDELKSRLDALAVQEGVMAPKIFNQKMAQLEEDKQKLAQEFMVNQQQLTMIEKSLASQMIKRIESIVRDLAARQKYMLIVDLGDESQPNVLYAKKGIDITNKVVAGYKKAFGEQPLRVPDLSKVQAPQR